MNENNTPTMAEEITRRQTLKAMEQLIVGMGGKAGYIKWLEALPDDATMTPSGGVTTETMVRIAKDTTLYDRACKAFAAHMAPILAEMGK